MGTNKAKSLGKLIPFFKQPEIGYCHPTCVKMVIDYAIQNLNIKQKKLSLKHIANVLKTDPVGGTVREDIELVNSLLVDSVPQIKFKTQISARLEEITGEIDEERPVISWINIASSEYDTIWHVVVISGYDLQKYEIEYVDPEMTVNHHIVKSPIGQFLDEKLGTEGRIIKLNISAIGQKDLNGGITPYSRRKENE